MFDGPKLQLVLTVFYHKHSALNIGTFSSLEESSSCVILWARVGQILKYPSKPETTAVTVNVPMQSLFPCLDKIEIKKTVLYNNSVSMILD